jgi:hypothetical protein
MWCFSLATDLSYKSAEDLTNGVSIGSGFNGSYTVRGSRISTLVPFRLDSLYPSSSSHLFCLLPHLSHHRLPTFHHRLHPILPNLALSLGTTHRGSCPTRPPALQRRQPNCHRRRQPPPFQSPAAIRSPSSPNQP